jgi:CheY-like chemotaxis protein
MNRLANVMMIDDNPFEIKLLNLCLQKSHVVLNLTSLQSGKEALEKLVDINMDYETVPDLILLDLNMPIMSGREVLKILKNDPVTRSIPVAIYSGSDSASDISECLELGANDYIVKPMDLDKLKRTVAKFSTLALIEKNGKKQLIACDVP